MILISALFIGIVCYAQTTSVDIEELMKTAETGDPISQNNLGTYYLNGVGVDKDYEKAIYWYQQAAGQELADAQYNIGICYLNGFGVGTDYEQAAYWFQKAADQEHTIAEYNMGYFCENGMGVAQDYERAAYWYRKAAEKGYAEAQTNLGVLYGYGAGVEQDFGKAAYWFQKSAEQGEPVGQYYFGSLYQDGYGVDQDYEQMAYWYQKSAEQGYARGQCNLAIIYEEGLGVEQSYEQAAYWYQKAADQGYVIAQSNLGVLYANGTGVEQDYEKAAYWYQKAADQGNSPAQKFLGYLYEEGLGVEKDYQQAAYWYNQALGTGDLSALGNLARLAEKKKALTDTLVSPTAVLPDSADIGDTIFFGHYEQDNDKSNGAEPIEWIVLDIDSEKALILSKFGLDVQAYNVSGSAVTWETSSLRAWLNEAFLEEAFTSSEQDLILTTTLDNSSRQGYSGYNTDDENNTNDKIFLLSYKDAFSSYFHNDSERQVIATAYAIANGAWVSSESGYSFWWLRSPGCDRTYAAGVGGPAIFSIIPSMMLRIVCVRLYGSLLIKLYPPSQLQRISTIRA